MSYEKEEDTCMSVASVLSQGHKQSTTLLLTYKESVKQVMSLLSTILPGYRGFQGFIFSFLVLFLAMRAEFT